MREIILVQVGQCGVQLGKEFWQQLISEHSETPDSVYFNSYTPRSVLVDLDSSPLDSLRAGPLGSVFDKESYVCANRTASNNWAKGYYTEGMEVIEDIMESLRKQAEHCESMQSFQLAHSLGGGTGSGLGTLIMSKVREEYPDKLLQTFSVFPSKKVSDIVVEPYNAVLATHQLIENSDSVVSLDNQALFNICHKRMQTVSYKNINQVASAVMSGLTCSFRFPSTLNNDLRKLSLNLIPFPRLHFLTTSYSPIACPKTHSLEELTSQLFTSPLCDFDSKYSQFLFAAGIFRGDFSPAEVESHVRSVADKYSASFAEWIPHNMHTSVCKVATEGKSATLIANSTGIKKVFERISSQFRVMHAKKAYMHWYLQEGMEELEFLEAEANLEEILGEYENVQLASEFNDCESSDEDFI